MNTTIVIRTLCLCICIFACLPLHSQEDAPYYYYKGEKHHLTVDRSRLYVTASEAYENLSGDTCVLAVHPAYVTAENDSIGMSSYFYVKLKQAADAVVLKEFAAKKQVVLVEQNRFMPLWYTLQCTKETPDHTLLVANLSPLSYDAHTGTSPSKIHIMYDNHATACAGIIGAAENNIQVVGVAPECTLVSISIHAYDEGVHMKVADGINWAVENGVDVLNCSWGIGTRSELVGDAIENALIRGRDGKGMVLVFSSGNDDSFNWMFPANTIDDLLVVGSVRRDGRRSDFSNYGSRLDLVAPGDTILCTISYNSVGYLRGTSMAAPHVSGVAALVVSRNPYLTGQEVCNLLEETAQKVDKWSFVNPDGTKYGATVGRPNGEWNSLMGYGLVDAYAAVAAACTEIGFVGETVTTQKTIEACDIYATDVCIEPGAKVTLDAREVITISKSFSVKKGARLELK